MRGRSLLILALLVGALAAFIGFYERKLPSSDERREQAKHVLQMKKDAVDAVTLERPGEPTVELVRVQPPHSGSAPALGGQSSARWALRKPWDFSAAGDAVDGLVDALLNLQQKREIRDFKPAELGLDTPRARVTLHTPEGERTLEIGAEVPGFSSMAVRVSGDSIAYVVADGLWSDIDKKAGEWRSRDVLNASRSDIRSISWTTNEGAVTLNRSGSDFRVAKPFEDVADQDRVDKLLTALTGLRVDHFLDQPATPGSAGENESARAARLQIELVDRRQPLEIDLGPAKGGELGVRYRGQDAVCKSDLMQRLAGTPSAWRSSAWTTMHVYDIHQATIQDAAGSVVIGRTDGGWQRDGKDIPFEAATDLLDAITGAQADAVHAIGKASAPAGKAAMTVELQPLEGGTAQTLSLFLDGEALNSARAVRLQMPPGLLSSLQTRLRDLRAAKPKGEDKQPATDSAAPGAANSKPN